MGCYSPALFLRLSLPILLHPSSQTHKVVLKVAMTSEISICHPAVGCALGRLGKVGSEQTPIPLHRELQEFGRGPTFLKL